MKKPPLLVKYKIIELVGYVIILLALVLAIVTIATGRGDKIPLHIGIGGDVEYVESPALFIIFPIMMAGCELMNTLCFHILPMDMFNMPFKVKDEYKVAAYYVGLDMLACMHIILAVFTLVFIALFLVGLGEGAAGASAMVMCGGMFIAIAVGFIRDYKLSKL